MKRSYLIIAVCLLPMTMNGYAAISAEENASAYFNTIVNNPNELRIFLQAMPKGGDLHNHLDGAVYAEDFIDNAVAQNDCLNPQTEVVSQSLHCNSIDSMKNVELNPQAYDRLIDTFSMRNYQLEQSPGDFHFFDSFYHFNGVDSYPQMLAAVLPTAEQEHIDYLELMLVPNPSKDMALAQHIRWTNDFSRLTQEVNQAGMEKLVKEDSQQIDQMTAYSRKQLRCGTNEADPACDVVVLYQYTPLRSFPPIVVFAGLLESFELSNQDSRVVGVNLVEQENNPTVIHNYDLQMQMIKYLHQLYPKVHISLHAGEMTLGQVPPSYLKNHIDEAVNVASAQRIGHGVDIAYEDNAAALLKEMADKHILVEINLTSNADILNVKGKNHPIMLYWTHHVPIALSTDDAGVLRTDLTHEYQRAVETYHFTYSELKAIDRNSLSYSFIPGASLWKNNDTFMVVDACKNNVIGNKTLSPTCQQFLASNQKANMQWRLEAEFNVFEGRYGDIYTKRTSTCELMIVT